MSKSRNAIYLCVVTCSLAVAAWQPGLSWQRREASEADSIVHKVGGRVDQDLGINTGILILRI